MSPQEGQEGYVSEHCTKREALGVLTLSIYSVLMFSSVSLD